MNTNKTPYEFIAPLVSEILQPILPLEYANATSYMEQLNMVCKKVVELVDAENKNPETIYNLVKQMYTEGSLQGIVADIISDICVNVKYPPAGLTPAKGDGKTNDWAAIVNILNYCKSSQNNILLYFPAGNYYATTETVDTMTFGGMIYGKTLTVCGCGRSSRLSLGRNKVRILCDLHNIAISAEGGITIFGNGLSVDYTTPHNTDIQGQGNNVYINMESTGYEGNEITFTDVAANTKTIYNYVKMAIKGHDGDVSMPNFAASENTVTVIGYGETRKLHDFYLEVLNRAKLTFTNGFDLKVPGRIDIRGKLQVEDQATGTSVEAEKSNGIWSLEKPVLLEGGDLDDIPTAGSRIRVQKDTIELAAKHIQFGDAAFDSQITETPAHAFKLYPATDEAGNPASILLKNKNTDNISVCFFNNVGFETDFTIPVPAEYLKTDDVISIELSGWCEDGENYPAKLTIGGQEYIFGRGDFYAKFLVTPLAGATDNNLKISGFSVDSEANYTGQKIYFFNKQLYVDLDTAGNVNFIFGHTGSPSKRVIYWSAVAHYN